MGWRCIRALKKVSAIAIPALQSAQDDPIPANVEEMATRPTFSLGDTMALGLMYREIFGNAKALQDDSECGERLRNIARCLEVWQGTSDELKEKYPGDAEMQAFMRMRIERGVLSWVTWLLAGKTPDEIRAMEDPPTLDLPDPP
jgi:hypothetical protein